MVRIGREEQRSSDPSLSLLLFEIMCTPYCKAQYRHVQYCTSVCTTTAVITSRLICHSSSAPKSPKYPGELPRRSSRLSKTTTQISATRKPGTIDTHYRYQICFPQPSSMPVRCGHQGLFTELGLGQRVILTFPTVRWSILPRSEDLPRDCRS